MDKQIELIERYISRAGGRVRDVIFHRETVVSNTNGDIFYVGMNMGYPIQHAFFVGNIHLWTEIYTVADLALKNAIRINLSTLLDTGVEYGDADIISGVNLRLALMGNGDYSGDRRLYNIAFNKINIFTLDLDPGATFMVMMYLSGYLFYVI